MSKTRAGFIVSPHGRHTPRSFGHDLGLDKVVDMGKSSILNQGPGVLGKHFNKLDDVIKIATATSSAWRLINGIKTAVVDNGENSVANKDSTRVPLLSHTMSNPLGKNDAKYVKTHVHVGRKSSKKIRKLQDNAFIEQVTKSLGDSLKDYQSHEKRNHLQLYGGFNQKLFTFLTEDLTLDVNNLHEFFNIDKWYKDEFKNPDGVTEIMGCIKKSHHKLKIKNRLNFFSAHVKVNLIKIHSLTMDTRSLLKDITHNSYATEYDEAGRIPIDLQFTSPDLYPPTNKCSVGFLTDLSCSLPLSTVFKEHACIVKSWSTTLSPASTWEINLTQHFGKGISLNYLNDIKQRQINHSIINQGIGGDAAQELLEKIQEKVQNKTKVGNTTKTKTNTTKIEPPIPVKQKFKTAHPVTYVLCLECVGDRRSSIIRDTDGDVFSGYSPYHLSLEFEHDLTYLRNQDSPTELLVYKRPKLERNFTEEEDMFAQLFCPDRETPLNIPYSQINFSGVKTPGQDYSMEYDQVISSNADNPNGLLGELGSIFKTLGLDPNTLTEEDAKFKFDKNPNEYNGPDSAPPPQGPAPSPEE